MENASLVELVPERSLLDPNFAGYKLSLDPIPLYLSSSPSKVDHVLRSEEQYSLQHVKLFGLQNHLFYDPWSANDVYFVDEKWMIQRNVLNQETGRLTGLTKVWEIPSNNVRRPGHYNPSASFPGQDLVLLSDGAGTLHLVKSGDRQKTRNSGCEGSSWQLLLSEEVCGPEVPFVLAHSLVEDREVSELGDAAGGRKVHCLLLHVEEAKQVKGQRSIPSCEGAGLNKSRATAFVTVIEWITLHEGKDCSWTVERIRKLCGSAIPDYVTIEAGGTGIVISSEQPFIFIEDTEKPLEKEEEVKESKGEEKADDCAEIDVKWQQDAEEIRLSVPLTKGEESIKLSELNVSVVDEKKVCVKNGEHTVLEGVTLHPVDHDLTTWELKDNVLHVCFHKLQEGQMWNKLFTEGPKCSEEIDPKLREEIHSRLSHLTSETMDPSVGSVPVFNSEELEECDEAPSNAASLCRFDGEEHVATHKACISSNQWLFNVQMGSGIPQAICLRHGPDGLLWQPVKSNNPQSRDESSSEQTYWSCSHVASFVSFGYVQASKQRKKFIACAPDASYVAVCEASQYVYVYRQPAQLAGDGQLRNRRTGQQISRVARQQLISLPSSQEILGVHASVTALYILVEDKLLAYMVNQ
ncbi:nudC domain-containing protein 1 [Ischnura elegans]|uniref:nudC domain-containing protein 1 n=1 Tax=Ischnura elegans TaxID=197161 RepID=UPI001ED86A12|nr:nudC domain-containing protein 1 [Ischnura elegans]